jgi:hypothetical protein
MSDWTNIGEQYNVYGERAVGKKEKNYNFGTAHADASLRELIDAVEVLRRQVSPAERQRIDESLETVRQGEKAKPSKLRSALSEIAGIAVVVGQVGAPVIEAVRKVTAAIGL